MGERTKWKVPPEDTSKYSSDTGGVKSLALGGRLSRERERLLGMIPEERAFRVKYLKSLELDPNEPKYTEAYYKELYNPIRRFYRAPLNIAEKALTPIVGETFAKCIRLTTSRVTFAILGIYISWYYLKYNTGDWTRCGGWHTINARTAMLPGDKDFPNYKQRTKPNEYYVENFDKSSI